MTPQLQASDPRVNAFVSANAGSGKTSTLVNRVARLLLDGAMPEMILCITYTKAAAAEMQRRLYETLGRWSVASDEKLKEELETIGEPDQSFGEARKLFAKALETPGGLKIQTIHAFCEKLLRRFPIEAGVSPAFTVLEDAAAAEVGRIARETVAGLAWRDPEGELGRAYAHLAVGLDFNAFEALFRAFERERHGLLAYADACRARGETVDEDVWRACGFPDAPLDPDAFEAEAVGACEWERWRDTAQALAATGKSTDAELSRRLADLAECAASKPGSFADCLAVFSTAKGEKSKRLGTKGVDPAQLDWLLQEQERLHAACARARAARVAIDTVHALTLGEAYVAAFEGAKGARGALDFDDLIRAVRRLLTETSAAAWVLYKLDGGVSHVLLDEAQDTSPDQWDIAEALTDDFYSGWGAKGTRLRTVFAVGDEKQSIYSFQGAAPEEFLKRGRAFEARALSAGAEFVAPKLEESWRSTPQVLGFVDAWLGDPAMRDAVPPPAGQDVVRHIVGEGRRDHAGQVDLWPPFQDDPAAEPEAWTAPVDAQNGPSAYKRLAVRVTQWIEQACARGEAVFDKALDGGRGGWRAMRPGDVLILVRKRGPFFEEMLRALKSAGLPSAGADRLKLAEHVVFDDLKALVRFALFPWDDLTLAALLRSPFCEVDEEGLYALAHGRTGRLWPALSARTGERPEWKAAADFLGAVREARTRGPFDFLGWAMSRLDASGRTMRQRLLTRLGPEAEDAVEEMLSEALKAEARGIVDLERFAAELERIEPEVKRELEGAGDAVRVMTVHGAKGLEAPVVILPDATAKVRDTHASLLRIEGGGYLFAPKGGDEVPDVADARAAAREAAAAEGLRLLYVALTRARDRLIVGGRLSATAKGPHESSWYAHVVRTFGREEIAAQVRDVQDGDLALRRFGPDPAFALTPPEASALAEPEPAWLRGLAPQEAPVAAYASPSAFAERHRGPAPSPLAAAGGIGRFRRGDLIHRLLQLLPDVAPEARAAAADRLLDRERDLSIEQRREMASAALGVLNDPRFAEVFGPGSRAEAAVAGRAPELPGGLAISGRVDRMVVTPERVLVVDFKTNRPSPDRIEQADPAYLVQMAVYVAVLRAIFPGRRVEAALVWTDGPKLMPVPENVIASKLVELKRLR